MHKLAITTVGLAMLLSPMLRAQTPDQSIVVTKPTENAADLGRFGQLPVDLSTGQVNLNIPLYTVSYGSISIPLNLNYNSSGVRVDQHSSWVGLGWSLAAGVITRNVKGKPDDFYYPDPVNAGRYGGSANGYLFCGQKLDVSDWYTSTLNMARYAASYDNNTPSTYYLEDGVPDDFSFNFGGYSGSIFIDEKGIWRVHSKDNLGLTISHEMNTAPFVFDQEQGQTIAINKLIQKFTITTPDGTKYVFGGNVNAMDYSRGTKDDFWAWQEGNPIFYNIMPSAWYLTKITKPTGEEVLLNYEKGLNVARFSNSYQGLYYGTAYADITAGTGYSTTSSSFGPTLYGSILTPCYLKEIITPLEKVEFFKSLTLEQTYDPSAIWYDATASQGNQISTLTYYYRNFWTTVDVGNTRLRGWPDFHFAKYTLGTFNPRPLNTSLGNVLPDYSQKLDSIVVSNTNTVPEKIKTISLNYTNHPSYRLFLQNISIRGAGQENGGNYTLDYFNMGQLPNYVSWKKDQWGYFNNSDYSLEQNKYLNNFGRLPSLTYAIYGSLKSIQYPTGGSSFFEYELNNYSKYQDVALSGPLGNTGTVSLVSTGNTNAGGLRIKKITSTSDYGAPPVIKEYYYNKDYLSGGTSSSGILSRRNKFIENMRFLNSCTGTSLGYSTTFSDNEFDPYGEDIKLVTYSEVTEKEGDGSFTIYKYSNYDDPGCLDEIHLTPFMFGVIESDRYKLTSNDLERGLLLKKEMYNSSSVKVQEEIYTYDYAPNRKQQFAKCIERLDAHRQKWVSYARNGLSGMCLEQLVYRLYPFLKYYYNIPLKEVTTNTYQSSGVVTNTKSFTYDVYGNIIQTAQFNSEGQKIIEKTKYNSNANYLNNAVSDDAISIRNLFTVYNIKNYPIEQTITLLPAIAPGQNYVAGSDWMTSGTLWKYAHNLPIVGQVLKMELSEPFHPVTYIGTQPTYHYTSSFINPSGGFVFDERYSVQSTFNSFSNSTFGSRIQPLTVSTRDKDITYTWDHRMQRITSQTQNTADGKVAFTSFEGQYFPLSSYDDNRGNWNFDKDLIIEGGFTGTKHIHLYAGASNTNIVSTILLTPGKKYVLSFWAKGTFPTLLNGTVPFGSMYNPVSTWKYFEFTVTGSNQPIVIGLQPGGQFGNATDLDEIRLYPADGMMETYTYHPISGAPSAIGDVKGRVTFYEYDGLGRLIHEKDQNGNILSKKTYSLQGPQ